MIQETILAHTTMAPTGGILFAEDFDLSDLLPNPAERNEVDESASEIIEPVYCAANLEAARMDGFAAGQIAALELAEIRRHEATNAALASIVRYLAEQRDSATSLTEATLDSVGKTLFACLVALLPATCARHQAGEVASLVRQTFAGMVAESSLRVAVAPDAIEDIRTALTGLDSSLLSRINLVPQSGLQGGDARIVWVDTNGSSISSGNGASRNARKTRELIIEILTGLGLLDPAPSEHPISRPSAAGLVLPPMLQPRFSTSPIEPPPTHLPRSNAATSITLESKEPAHG